jgi:hypothetical protein
MAWISLVLVVWAAPGLAGTAQIQLESNSLRMNPGTCSCGPGTTWRLYFSTYFTDFPAMANGEIAPRQPGAGNSHWAYMILEDISMWAAVTYCEINLPLAEDSDLDGVSDFLEPERSVFQVSTGTYVSDLGGGTLSLTWSRTGGSLQGACQIYMHDQVLGVNGPFNHTFELVAGSGTFNYTRTGDTASGWVTLQDGNVQLQGPMQLTRVNPDPVNQLSLAGSTWTNTGTSLTFASTTLTRNPAVPALYKAQLGAPGPNYGSWNLRVIDPTDSDKDGIPDLSDSSTVQPPTRPAISLRRNGNKLELAITGDAGVNCGVQSSTTLTPDSWQTVKSFSTTNTATTVELDAPASGPLFWRVQSTVTQH